MLARSIPELVKKNKSFERNYKPAGDCLGHTNVLELGVKVTSIDLPMFKNYQLETHDWTFRPFMFTNIAILPSEFNQGESLSQNIVNNWVASTGFGLQFIQSFLAAELYYCVVVKKRDYEFGAELQLNFGLD